MDIVKVESASTGLAPPASPPPPGPGGAPGTAASRVSSADAAGGPGGVGGGRVSKSGDDAVVVLDLGKVLPAPPEEQKKEGALDAAAAPSQGGCPSVVIDVKSENLKGADAGADDGGSWGGEKECRICHLNPESDRRECSDAMSELIQLGCGCKNDLGIAHRHCAEAWFKLKGNRCCEICGSPAKNVTGIEDANFLEEWNERTPSNSGNGTANERCRCWRGQPLCNFLMACLVIAFILPWFFRVNMF